jgi:hypothetical protein
MEKVRKMDVIMLESLERFFKHGNEGLDWGKGYILI